MARSRSKHPSYRIGSDSNYTWKRKANRRLRRLVKQSLLKEEEYLPILREVSNLWTSDKEVVKYWERPHESEAEQAVFLWRWCFPSNNIGYYHSVEFWRRNAFRK